MKNIKSVFTILFALLTLVTTYAQVYPHGERDRSGENHGNNSRLYINRDMQPLTEGAFNRDLVALDKTDNYHIDKVLRDYTKSHYLTSEQVARLALLLRNDIAKHDFLTYSMYNVIDSDNFSKTSSVFDNDISKEVFFQYLLSKGVRVDKKYYKEPNYIAGGYYTPPPPQYDRNGNLSYNTNTRNDNRNDPYYSNINNNNRDYYNNQNSSNGRGQMGVNSSNRGLLSYRDFEILKEKIKLNTFEKSKLNVAKQITQENVLTTNQISEIARMLSFENSRLDYAKFAYDYVYDRENYTAVGEAMSFEQSKKDLIRYIESRKKS